MSDVDFSVSEALNYAAAFELDGCIGTPCEVAIILAAEVRRLRAGVEAVRALPRYDCLFDGMHVDTDGDWIDRDDVLAALEAE